MVVPLFSGLFAGVRVACLSASTSTSTSFLLPVLFLSSSHHSHTLSSIHPFLLFDSSLYLLLYLNYSLYLLCTSTLVLPYSTGSDLQPATIHGSLLAGSVISTAGIQRCGPIPFPSSSSSSSAFLIDSLLFASSSLFLLRLPPPPFPFCAEKHCPELPLLPFTPILFSSQPPLFALQFFVCASVPRKTLVRLRLGPALEWPNRSLELRAVPMILGSTS